MTPSNLEGCRGAMMNTITERDLELHAQWCANPRTGERLERVGVRLYEFNLAGANLAGAYLAGARLIEANLHRADLTRTTLFDADLTRANLTGAKLHGTDLSGAILTNATLPDYHVPFVPQLHSQLLAALERPGNELDMGEWHTCETVHSWAGWIVTLAGAAGRALEEEIDTSAAAALIAIKSCRYLNGVVLDWYHPSKIALAKIRAYAKLEAA